MPGPMPNATIPSFQLSVRCALSAAGAVGLAQILHLQYPIYALVGAVIVCDLAPAQTRQLAVRRLWGTVVGATVGAALSTFLSSGAWQVGCSIFVALFLSHLLRLQGAARVTGYICGIVVLDHGDHPWSYALYRLIETVLGLGMALLVSFVPKLLAGDGSGAPEP